MSANHGSLPDDGGRISRDKEKEKAKEKRGYWP
jgi:hypothetical protein